MQILLQDLKYAAKMFRDSPAFTVAVLVALTIGIGANVAIFSVVNTVVLKPIPFDEPDAMVRPMNLNRQNGAVSSAASPAKYMHWRAQSDIFDDVAAYRLSALNYTAGDVPERIRAAQVTEGFFRTFRAPIAQGRTFSPEEDVPNSPKTVVLTWNFWQDRLAGEPNIIGKTLSLSGSQYAVIGITGADFDLREFGDPELFIPFGFDPNTADQGHYFTAFARLKPGVTMEQAQERMNASADAFKERFPNVMGQNGGFTVRSLQESMVGPTARRTLWMLLGAVAFVLLIACANVANLLLIRATGRSREIAIRVAMGAGRTRILRQLMTESVLLSLTGGALGLVAGFLGMRGLLAINTAGLPRLGAGGGLMGMDWRVVTFTLALSMVTGIVFGLFPALVGARTDLNAVIKDSSSRAGSGRGQNRARAAVVVFELGLCIVLLVGAGLMIRTSVAISRVEPGFATENVITMRTSLTDPRFQTSAGTAEVETAALERIKAIPGVAEAVATCCVPLQGGYGLPFNIIGRENEGPFTGGGSIVVTSAGYPGTFEIPILKGRDFNELDDGSSPPVVLINQAMVDQYWGDGSDPLSDRLLIGGGAGNMKELADEPIRQIVGVLANVRAQGITNDPQPTMYLPQAQIPDPLNALQQGTGPVGWVVRTDVDPSTVSASIQEEIRRVTGAPVTDVELMSDVVSISTSRQRVNMILMMVFGASALLLAAIGIYGLMAYSVQQRTQEIGIRKAMGADAGVVRTMVVRQGMSLVVVGMVVGLVAAYFLANVLASFLFEVEPRDPVAFSSVAVVLTVVALAAVMVPALRASRVNPLQALRID